VKSKASGREVLARNLRALKERYGLSEREIGKRTKVAQKTINNILKCSTSPTIETLDRIARPFGLSGWQLQVPDFISESMNGERLDDLIEHYAQASPDGREYINRGERSPLQSRRPAEESRQRLIRAGMPGG